MSKIIIFIEGVYTSDISDIFADSLSEDSNSDSERDVSKYDIIPNKYTGLSEWPLTTNVICAHCGMTHSNPPVFIPKYFNTTSKKISITINKILFCSFPCAAKYIEDTSIGSERRNKHDMLKFVYKEFTGNDIAEIPLAPNRSEIDIFAGGDATYTSNKFVKLIEKLVSFSEYQIGEHSQK